jgi:phage-related protein
MGQDKEIRWVGSSYDDLLAFPEEPRRQAGFQLGKIQASLDPDDWKPFAAVGPGTREIRLKDKYRRLPGDVRGEVRGSHLCTALLPEKDAGHQPA